MYKYVTALGVKIIFRFVEMKALWLYPLALCSLSVVLAQNNNDTCDISLGGFDSVPRMCESLQRRAAGFLNFTLADNGSIIFIPLPPARIANIEVNDDSDGLKGWANLANAFVDSVRSGSLPYGNVVDNTTTITTC